MVEPHGSPLNGGQVQLAKRYKTVLRTLNEEFPERFKSRQVTKEFDDIGRGDLLKLKKRGLLNNEYVDSKKAKDWFLTRKTKRWLRTSNGDSPRSTG